VCCAADPPILIPVLSESSSCFSAPRHRISVPRTTMLKLRCVRRGLPSLDIALRLVYASWRMFIPCLGCFSRPASCLSHPTLRGDPGHGNRFLHICPVSTLPRFSRTAFFVRDTLASSLSIQPSPALYSRAKTKIVFRASRIYRSSLPVVFVQRRKFLL